MASRYALYAAPPPDSPLWRFGSSVIGYDAARAVDCPFPAAAPCDAADWAALTEEPRRYGFHGTLKAPFALVEGEDEAALIEAVMLFAERRRAFSIPRLEVALLKSFVALVPMGRSEELEALAADCVRVFEPFRAPLSQADLARRLKAPLTERQKAHLDAFGYPYIFEDFRFHMTLTGALAHDRQATVHRDLSALYAPLDEPFAVDAVCLFRQDDRAGRFTVLGRFPFEG